MTRPILCNAEREALMGKITPDGDFEVYSVVDGDALSAPMTWDKTWEEFDRIGNGDGMDVRKYVPKINPALLTAFTL